MNRKAIATLILAGLVTIGTSGASGGCGSGGDGGTSAPAVGAGGEQSAPSGEHSSAEETADEPSEPPAEGHDPCNAHLSPITIGHKVSATLTVGPCTDQPEQYDGTLELQFGTGDLPHVNWDRATVIPIYSTNATQTISAPCQDTYWVVVYDTSGRDHNGHSFSHSYSRFYDDIPRKANCP
ncbi:MAG: hypothetical protein HOY79_28870 [Streptomyces sp.]|nr:hypothetical protein [Streptomyces sp.]